MATSYPLVYVKGNSFKKELLDSLTRPGHSSKDHPIRRNMTDDD